MAEVIIPMLGLGAMYILSNEDKKNNQNNNSKNNNSINNNLSNINQTQFSSSNRNNMQVNNYNQHTDKYYNENNYSSLQGQNTSYGVGNNNNPNVKSLTGNIIDKDDFTHNNMVPFFGSKIRGATSDNQVSQTILDNKQGAGSQIYKKREGAPLFSPEDNVNNLHGMQNNSDFFQTRMNVGNNMSNARLWEPEKVGPGLNGTSDMGFNSGMTARELWQPKNVDELRVDNNPKLSYELQGHEGPALNIIKEMGSIGKVEKHLPEKFYNNGPSRWLTTTGLEKGPTQRGELIMQDQGRNDTMEYFGNTGNNINTTYAKRNFEESKKINLDGLPIVNASASGRANNDTKPSFTNYNNNRSTTQNQLDFGAVSGLAQAILTPIMDILKPTRKENVIGNLRQNGNVQNSVTNGYLLNKNDTPNVTNRQMYCESKNHLNIQKQSGNGYLTSNPELLSNQRETTSINYIGNSGASSMGFKSNEAVNNQRNNVNKTHEIHPNQGGTQIFNQQMNVCYAKNDCDRNNNRMWVPTDAPKSYNNTQLTANNTRGLQSYDEKLNNDRLNPNLLNAFKNNPYTQSLQSIA